MRASSTLALLLVASTTTGCFTATGFGVGWRIDRVHNTRELNPRDLGSLPAGEPIRLLYDGTANRGALVGADSVVVIFRPRGGAETRVPLMDVQSARRDRRRKSGRVIGALIGLGVDVAVLAIIANDLAFFPDYGG